MNENASPFRVGIVVPTLNAGQRWPECLDAINRQSVSLCRRLVIDSGSTDETVVAATAAGFEVLGIERTSFNHGATRQWAAEYLAGCDIIVFITQDAVLAGTDAIAKLRACFEDPRVAVAYGRQLPHRGASSISAHSRLFNYGSKSLVKDSGAVAHLGTKVYFCSNSFAAYRRSVLMSLGGFSRDLILGEDMEFAARAIKAGYANAYCAEAHVFHSHDYTLLQTLERYFDLGVFESRNGWMRRQFGSHSGEGLRFVASELRYLADRDPLRIVSSICQTAAKFIGYRLGLSEALIPLSWKRRLSMFPGYFRNPGPLP